MRGKAFFAVPFFGKYGITPAYAGKSVAQAALNLIMRDHPRLCGEKAKMLHPIGHFRGSPPPMRGKEKSLVRPYSENRITPAYAGKRSAGKTWARVA